MGENKSHNSKQNTLTSSQNKKNIYVSCHDIWSGSIFQLCLLISSVFMMVMLFFWSFSYVLIMNQKQQQKVTAKCLFFLRNYQKPNKIEYMMAKCLRKEMC